MKKGGIFMVKVIVTIAVLFTIFTGGMGWAAEELKIGGIFPLSGPLSEGGRQTWYGVQIATEMINEKGGVQGKTIKIILADAPDIKAGRSEAERLINLEGVKIIIGSYYSGLAYAASEIAERNRVLYWETVGVADEVTERGFKYTFRVACKGSQGGELGAQYIKDIFLSKLGMSLNKARIAVVYEDSIWGTTAGTSFINNAKAAGLNIVESLYYARTSTDLSSVVLKLKESQPDILYMSSLVVDGCLFLKQAKELGLRPKAIFAYGVCCDKPWYDSVGQDMNNIFCLTWPAGGINVNALTKKDQADLREFEKRWRSKYKEEKVHAFSYGGFAGAKVLYEHVLPKATSLTDPEALRKAVLSVDIPDGGTVYGWGAKFVEGTGQNTRTYFALWQWQEGNTYIVFPEKLATRKPVFKPPFTK